MIDLLNLGQGPRPDVLEREMKAEASTQLHGSTHSMQKRAKKVKNAAVSADDDTQPDKKDIAAMIFAMFQLVLPWIALFGGIFFIVVLLITRI